MEEKKKPFFANINQYKEFFRKLIEKERKVQKRTYEKEISQLSPFQREKLGRTITNVKAKLREKFLEYYIYKFTPVKKDNEFSVGDVVLVTPMGKSPLKEGKEGTVYEKTKTTISIAMKDKLNTRPRYRIDLYVNDITFKRMEEALERINERQARVLLGKEKIRIKKERVEEWKNKNLNVYQKEGVEKALGSDLLLIHGPPGTGKTTTLVEVIYQLAKKGKRVLASADSNVAVDNLAERLIKAGLDVIRIGHPARIQKSLLPITLEERIKRHPKYSLLLSLQKYVDKLRERQKNFQKPTPGLRRGLSDKAILKLAKEKKGSRGLSKKTIESMAQWILLQRDINEGIKKRDEILKEIEKTILAKAKVITATNSTTGWEILEGENFDAVVIDEATQSTEPSALIPFIKGKKWILAGDHKQLPPTVLSEDERLKVSMFERLASLYPNSLHLLRIQYRMNEKLMDFPSKTFYNGKLIAHEKVKNIKLSDLTGKEGEDYVTNDEPLVFINVEGREIQRKGSFSKRNIAEKEIVKNVVDQLLEIGVKRKDIGIITPYKDQVNELEKEKELEGIEIKTVDGFQGKEKEVIILSLVRANPRGEIGFLKDYRRLNVALTRAKRKLIIIGNRKTLERDEVYRSLLQRCKIIPTGA